MTHADYYDVLGVTKTADAKQIKDAYREMAFRYHPDRNRDDPSAAEKMKHVNEAYAVLSNAGKRSEYDRIREQMGSGSARDAFRRTYTEKDIYSGSDIFKIFEEMARMHGMRGFEDIFKETYGPGYQTFEFKRPGFTFRGFVFGPGQRGAKRHGGRLHHHGPSPSLGRGKLGRFLFERLTGRQAPQDGAHMVDTIHLSPDQAARGGPYAYFHRKRRKKLVVKIPPGVKESQKIRLAGLGEEGRGGGRSGDLFLRVEIQRPIGETVRGWVKGLLGR